MQYKLNRVFIRFKYIFLIIFWAFVFLVTSKNIDVYAGVSFESAGNGCGIKLKLGTGSCTQWKKKGDSCTPTVEIENPGTTYTGFSINATPAKKNDTYTINISGRIKSSTGTSGGSNCNTTYRYTVATVFDLDPPSCYFTSESGWGSSVTVKWAGYELSNGKNSGFDGPDVWQGSDADGRYWRKEFTQTYTSNGSKSFKIYDKAGNPTTCKANVTHVDTTAPSAGVCKSISGWYNSKNGVKLEAKCSADTGVGCDGKWRSATAYYNKPAIIQICDAAGNCSTKSCSVTGSGGQWDTADPVCSAPTISPQNNINNYLLGQVTATWKCSDNQSGCSQTYYSSTKRANSETSAAVTISDKVGRTATCYASWNRDQTGPNSCSYTQPSHYSNSSITITAKCRSDGQTQCGSQSHTGSWNYNAGQGPAQTISIYDITEDYWGPLDTNRYSCPVAVTHIDKAAPTCTAEISVQNPVLSSDGKKWTTNTWHTSGSIVDENGKTISTTNQGSGTNITRVQAWVKTSQDQATAGADKASGIKGGFGGANTTNGSSSAISSLNGEARTTVSEGNNNGTYSVFVRDNVVDVVTNNKKSWSGTTLYAHGTTTSGNIGECSKAVYSFDTTKPVAHVQLFSKMIDGEYNVWNSDNTLTNTTTKTVNNNANSVKNWSSVDITVQFWGTDPEGTSANDRNYTYKGRSGIKRLCYRMVNADVNSGKTSAWVCENISNQKDGNATDASTYRTMIVPSKTYSGITTVYVKVQDWAGNWSDEVSQKTYIDTTTPKVANITEITNGQDYNNMTYKSDGWTSPVLSRPWVNTLVTTTYTLQDNKDNAGRQAAGSYQVGYKWTNTKQSDAQLSQIQWEFINSDKTAGVSTATTTPYKLPGLSNPNLTQHYYLYVRVCDNVKMGPRNCEIYGSDRLIRYDRDNPKVDDIFDVSLIDEESTTNSSQTHDWTNALKLRIRALDEPFQNVHAGTAYIKYKWNNNPNDASGPIYSTTNNKYTGSSTGSSSQKEDSWTYVNCTDANADYCRANINFATFVGGISPVKEGYRYLNISVCDYAGNCSAENYGPFKYDITPPVITGLDFRGRRADNNSIIEYSK